MASNNDKHVVGNSNGDRISLFYDGRVKVRSTAHLWTVSGRERQTALGESVHIEIGERLKVPRPKPQRPDIDVPTDPALGRTVAATVCADNGTFVQLFHDGTITVGNDGRDIRGLLNAGRYANSKRNQNGVGGSVMVVFEGTYRPQQHRSSDYPLLHIPEDRPPSALRLYPDEFEIETPGFG
ncbi:hypothetical protein [Nocardia gamkensis]|uniref:Uncharacterized protein n=1 Tax=Nocardia gamkensis TaxID=352869 RepID=A0A7X6L4R5_9NOCA|nr:hypothetical protein [Nocardia gamkensis]NKY27768.1 hypothetical protein [Nocardia gamkensis]NQE67409.1 hypothetical protein [Nocardia gamkensis]